MTNKSSFLLLTKFEAIRGLKMKVKDLPWRDFYSGDIIPAIPEECRGNTNSGFIYWLKFNNGMNYIGKKNFYVRHTAKKLSTGNERAGHISWTLDRKREHFYTESNWKDYLGSGKGYRKCDVIEKYIIRTCQTKKQLCYYEAFELFAGRVLLDKTFYNDNILGKFYRRDLM
jgi:hypothetical protein